MDDISSALFSASKSLRERELATEKITDSMSKYHEAMEQSIKFYDDRIQHTLREKQELESKTHEFMAEAEEQSKNLDNLAKSFEQTLAQIEKSKEIIEKRKENVDKTCQAVLENVKLLVSGVNSTQEDESLSSHSSVSLLMEDTELTIEQMKEEMGIFDEEIENTKKRIDIFGVQAASMHESYEKAIFELSNLKKSKSTSEAHKIEVQRDLEMVLSKVSSERKVFDYYLSTLESDKTVTESTIQSLKNKLEAFNGSEEQISLSTVKNEIKSKKKRLEQVLNRIKDTNTAKRKHKKMIKDLISSVQRTYYDICETKQQIKAEKGLFSAEKLLLRSLSDTARDILNESIKQETLELEMREMESQFEEKCKKLEFDYLKTLTEMQASIKRSQNVVLFPQTPPTPLNDLSHKFKSHLAELEAEISKENTKIEDLSIKVSRLQGQNVLLSDISSKLSSQIHQIRNSIRFICPPDGDVLEHLSMIHFDLQKLYKLAILTKESNILTRRAAVAKKSEVLQRIYSECPKFSPSERVETIKASSRAYLFSSLP